MNGKGALIFAATFTAVLVLAAAYIVQRAYSPPASASPPTTPEVRQYDLYLHTFEAGDETVRHWVPAVVVANAGDTIILRLHNTDPEASHGFLLAAMNINVAQIPPGQTATVRLVPRNPGIYHFGCSMAACAPDHESQIGQLVVLGGR